MHRPAQGVPVRSGLIRPYNGQPNTIDTTTMSEEDANIGLHRPGSIRRIKLHNFLTHGDVEFWPGPRLNMVIGANGTGKSTLLNAICLGLGGDPKLLGRADDLREFIMHKKDKAEIEIELEPHEGKETHILRRTIDRHKGSEKGRGRGASSLYINDEKSNVQAVRELVSATYNIQIDNLCTFLPQDKVGNFSGFSDQDRLLETEKILPSNQYFYNVHQELIEKEASMENDIDNVQSIRDTLKNKKHEFERLEIGKAREEERAQAEAHLDLLQKKRLWLQFEMLREEGIQLKEEKNRLKAEIKKAGQEIAPLEERHQRLESHVKELSIQSKTINDNRNRAQKDLDKHRQKFETHDDAIDQCMSDLMMIDEERRKAQEVVDEAQKRYSDLLEQQRGHPDRQELETELREAKESLKVAKREFDIAKRGARQEQERIRELEEKAGELQDKLAKLNDHTRQRKEQVFRAQANLGKVAKWINENRQQFRRPVWGPVAVEVETRSQNTAAYLEFHVPNNIMRSFITETEEDRKLLYSEVREKLGIPVNVISVEGKQLDHRRIYTDEKMEILKKDHGVQCYLDQTFTAPDPVMITLQVWASVHKVLVGDERTQESIDKRGLKEFLSEPDAALAQNGPQRSCIFTAEGHKSYRHTTAPSRYSGKIGTRTDDVGPARLLAPAIDPSRKKKAEDELAAVLEEVNQIRPAQQQAEQRKKEVEAHAQQCNLVMFSKKQALEGLMKFQSKLERAEARLEEAQAKLGGDDEGRKKELVSEIMNRLKNSIAAIKAHGQQHDIIMQHVTTDAGVTVNRMVANNAERAARQALDEKKETFNKIKEEATRAHKKFNDIKVAMQQKKKEADELAPLTDENGDPTPLKAKLEELQATEIHEVDAAVEEAERLLNQYDANPEVIRQYEILKAEIEKIEDQLANSTETRERNLQAIDEMRKDWETRLEVHVSKINNLFGEYMQEMGCTGEVRLSKGPKYDDVANERPNFKLWGIEILVSFRNGAKAQILSAQRHSGGERSVSTILYLMALQDLMVAPFRCVDEINQGLDDRNERLVFRRIVSNSTRKPQRSLTDHAGQYWLITPKLLPNLTDMEVDGLTVLFVTNGPGNFKCNSDYNNWMGKGDTPSLIEADEDENGYENIPRRKPKKSRLS